MTMKRYPRNPIEQRKRDVRKYSRAAAWWAGTGLVGGVAMGMLVNPAGAMIVVVGALAGCGVNYARVQSILKHKDNG